jgi:serine/threonine protein kinase/WD40 repeat protein
MGDEPTPVKPASPEQMVFAGALLCATPEAQAAYLDGACGPDTALRRRVEALLRAAEGAGDFLEEPPTGLSGEAGSTQRVTELASEQPGDRIGRYKLLEKIGEGGCGVVYMAEQEEPVRRRVALKILKLGMDTRSGVARFEAERQALALMDHPNIAKVLDGGATNAGRLYFVMELVRGVRITEFCDQARLATAARLRLFVLVCQAVQHAHQKGIIHRDLKPSNILVTVNDGVPVPKVIDFGIAKAIAQKLTDKTLFTEFQALLGTPAYMSPEQADMSSVDIDTRSDIYALGVLLYELLTGKTPFDGEELLRSGLDEMRRIIRETEPPKPSTRLTNLAAADGKKLQSPETTEAEVQASSRRLLQMKELVNRLRGDLDWIVMKCLEKDRARRYETANGLAADIQRHLDHEPVVARPPGKMYRLQKMARRNQGALLTAATVLVALLVAVFALATSNVRIRQERNQKDHALRERGAALAAARASEQQAREQLFVSLQSQAQARRNSRQMGQRLESLAALAEAARIRPAPELRDSAIAAMAIPDVERGPVWQASTADSTSAACDSLYQRYARIGQDGTISIRTIPEDRELQRLESNPSIPLWAYGRWIMFSPDGRFLAKLEDNRRLRLWQCESGESVLSNPPEQCCAMAFSSDGRQIAVGQESSIVCFDLATGQERRRWQALTQPYALRFNPDGRSIAVGYAKASVVSIYDAEDARHLADLPVGAGTEEVIEWHPDGKLLAATGSDPRIQIWNVEAQRKVAVLEGHVQQVTALSFHPGGELLTSASWEGVVRLWEPSPARLLMRLPSAWISFSREGRWAGVISPSPFQAQLWGIVPSQEYRTFLNTFRDGKSMSAEGDISPDGTLLALAASDGVRLWDVASGREVAWLRLGDTTAVLFRADGRELLTCGPGDGLRRWGIVTSTEPEGGLELGPFHRIELPFDPRRMAKGRDDRTLAVVGESAGQCVLLDLVTESVRVAEMPHAMAGYVAVSPDGERLATSGWHSDRVKVWDGSTGKLIKEWEVGKASAVFFTPDNREMIVARGIEFTFHDRNSLEVSRRMPRDIGLNPGHVAFSADGKLMALEMAPGLIHLKEISSGRTVARLEDPQGDHSTWMSFTPDGTQLVVAARYAGAIHRWDLRAIRERLKTMNLDWDWPEFSAPSPSGDSFSKSPRPLRVQVVGTVPSPTNVPPAKP